MNIKTNEPYCRFNETNSNYSCKTKNANDLC